MPLPSANGASQLCIALPGLQEHAQEAGLVLCWSLKVTSQKEFRRSVVSFFGSPGRDFTAVIPCRSDGWLSEQAPVLATCARKSQPHAPCS